MYVDRKSIPTAVNIEKRLQISRRSIDCSILHNHAFYEIEIVLSGSGVCNLNGQQLDMGRGFLYVNSPLDFHAFTANPGDTIELINFTFSESVIRLPEFVQFTESALQKHFILSEGELQKLICLSDCMMDEPYDVQKPCFESMLKIILRNFPTSHTEHGGPISAAIEYIQEHFQETITIEDMARLTNLSVPYFSKRFKQKTGMNYKTYCSSVKIAHAMKLFASSDLNATEVCFRSGFNSYSVFARTFKQQTAMTPKEYVASVSARQRHF